MGLILAALGSAGGVLADQWKEYFYCESLPNNVLAVKGRKRNSGRSSNTRGSDNIISSGSVIAVADGQCMLIVEQGKIVDVCAEPGEYVYDSSTEPSIFSGKLGEGILNIFKQIGKRFTFGGEAPKDQRVYYFNTKEITGNKYGTPSPVPFRVVDQNIGLDIDISIRCFGEYSFLLSNPLLFYTNVCGNVSADYTKEQLEGQMKTELLTALQPAFARISEMGIRYSALPGHTTELADALNEELSAKWRDLRGMEIASIGVSSVKASEEDEAMIKEMQRNAAFRNPNMAAAHLVGAQAAAMQAAHGLHGHEHGRPGRRRRRCQPLPDGPAAGCRPRRSRGRRLDLPQLRRHRHGQVLPRVRRQEARGRRGLDLPQLRHREQGQVLCRVRRQEARRRHPVPLRQVRLGARSRRQAAQVLPRVRRSL